jgi:protein-S-isoprenylcysteine O-methyltransferase Ste14
MSIEDLKHSALPRALADAIADAIDLFQKELRLARAEISDKLTTKFKAGAYFAVAGLLGFVVVLVLVQAAIFALAARGIPLHWSCLIVAAVLAAAAGAIFALGRADAKESVSPDRTIAQIKQDIATAKESFK